MRKGDEGKKGGGRSRRQRTESTFSPPAVMYYVPRTDGERERERERGGLGWGACLLRLICSNIFASPLFVRPSRARPSHLSEVCPLIFSISRLKWMKKKEGNRERERETTLMNEGEFLPRFVVEEGKRRGRDGNRQRRVSLA